MPEISFWRDLERRFLRLQEDGNRMGANWSSVPCTAAGDHWYLDGGGTEFVRKRFQTLAESAAVELGHSVEASGLFFWLDLLKDESPYYSGGGISNGLDEDGQETTSTFGHVPFVCAASSEFCTKCETRAALTKRADEQKGSTVQDASRNEQKPGSQSSLSLVRRLPSGPSGGANLLKIGERFRTAGEQFRLGTGCLRAEFITLPERESWGIWKLRPNTKESEAAREKFELMATLAVLEFGITPMPAPQAREFDPNWPEQAWRFASPDRSEPIPSGLNEVDPCTRAWLHFLRLEAEKNERLAFKARNGGLSIPDVWEGSAVQCERTARELIEASLLEKAAVPGHAPGGTAPTLSFHVDQSANLGNGSTKRSDGPVAVCPSIIPGHFQTPELFSSEEEARRWLSQGNPQNGSGANDENLAEPVAQEAIPGTGSPSTDPPPPGDLVDVNSHNERWRPPIRVAHIATYDLSAPFEGSIADFLPRTITQVPEAPTLRTKIGRYLEKKTPAIECSLAEDWEFEKISMNPLTRLGRYNLVEQAGITRTVLQLAEDLEMNLKSRFPKLPAAAIADFWRSWQTSKYLADCCYELGQSEAAITHMKDRELAESAVKKIHGYLTTQVAAFSQAAADGYLVSSPRRDDAAEADVRTARDETAVETAVNRDDPRRWSPAVQQWEAFKSLRALHSGPRERVPEAVLRTNVALQLGIQPEDVTGDQILQEVGQLIRHYGVVEVIASPLNEEGSPVDGPAMVSKDSANASATSDSTIQRDHEGGKGIRAKGNVQLLQGQTAVSFRTAEKYLGVSTRQRQKLVKSGALQLVGGGLNRKITVESLINYLPTEKAN